MHPEKLEFDQGIMVAFGTPRVLENMESDGAMLCHCTQRCHLWHDLRGEIFKYTVKTECWPIPLMKRCVSNECDGTYHELDKLFHICYILGKKLFHLTILMEFFWI